MGIVLRHSSLQNSVEVFLPSSKEVRTPQKVVPELLMDNFFVLVIVGRNLFLSPFIHGG